MTLHHNKAGHAHDREALSRTIGLGTYDRDTRTTETRARQRYFVATEKSLSQQTSYISKNKIKIKNEPLRLELHIGPYSDSPEKGTDVHSVLQCV